MAAGDPTLVSAAFVALGGSLLHASGDSINFKFVPCHGKNCVPAVQIFFWGGWGGRVDGPCAPRPWILYSVEGSQRSMLRCGCFLGELWFQVFKDNLLLSKDVAPCTSACQRHTPARLCNRPPRWTRGFPQPRVAE